MVQTSQLKPEGATLNKMQSMVSRICSALLEAILLPEAEEAVLKVDILVEVEFKEATEVGTKTTRTGITSIKAHQYNNNQTYLAN